MGLDGAELGEADARKAREARRIVIRRLGSILLVGLSCVGS